MPARAGVLSRAISKMDAWRSATTPQSARSGRWRWAGRTICSPVPMPAVNAPRQPTRSLKPPSSTAQIPKLICATCSDASPIITSTVSANFCPGTSPAAHGLAPQPDRFRLKASRKSRSRRQTLTPHLVRPDNLHPAQQIRVDLVAGLRLRRPRTAIERLYPHPLHQRLHMTTPDLAPLGSQQASQHPRASKGELQMQTVETPHERKLGFRHRARQIVDAATADVQSFRLLADGQIVRGLDHRFALSKPALPSAPSKKSFSSVSSPIFACTDFTSTAGCAAPLPPGPNTSAAPSSSCAFHDVI